MPTEPYKPILDRNLIKDLPQRNPIAEVTATLREAVNYATNAFHRCEESRRGRKEESLPVLVCFLHMIQMTDAIEVLLSSGCGPPASVLLRSSFEAKLTVEHILKCDSKRRGYDWLVCYVLQEIKVLERFGSPEFCDALSSSGLGGIPTDEIDKLPAVIERLKSTLERPGYTEAYSEYRKLRTARKGSRVEWYALHDGPSTIRGLAKRLHQEVLYETLYHSTSKVTHGQDINHLLFPMKNGPSVFAHLRDPLKVLPVVGNALTFLLGTTFLMLREYRSGEASFRHWYQSEMMSRGLSVLEHELEQLQWYRRMFIDSRDTTENSR